MDMTSAQATLIKRASDDLARRDVLLAALVMVDHAHVYTALDARASTAEVPTDQDAAECLADLATTLRGLLRPN